MGSNFHDVGLFHQKFDLPTFYEMEPPTLLDDETLEFRLKFLREELKEFEDAHREGRLVDAFDGLIDLVYVALGTAHMMRLPWQEGWEEVQRANMTKMRAQRAEESTRNSTLDVVKPPGWIPPNLQMVLDRYML